jgi:hypothetical protein
MSPAKSAHRSALGEDVSESRIRGIAIASLLAAFAAAGPLRASAQQGLHGAGATTSELSLPQAAWARELTEQLGIEQSLGEAPSDAERVALLCPEGAELETGAGGHRAAAEAFAVSLELGERGPGEPVREVVSVPATALYQLEVEGAGHQRWVIDGRPVGHLDVSTLGVAQAPIVVALRAGPHELSGTLLRDARATRVRLSAWRSLCIAPAEGWRPERPLAWGGFARTLVGAYGLVPRLPEEEGSERRVEGEDYDEATDGGALTRRRLRDGASRDAWATAATGVAEFTWRVRLEKPALVTLSARTHGAQPQRWSIDGRYAVTVEPAVRDGGFAWSPVATLPLSAGEHALRARIARGAGIDAIRIVRHRSSDADHLRIVAQLGFPIGAPDSAVPRSLASGALRRPLALELSRGFQRRLDGERTADASVVLSDLDGDGPSEHPLSPALPAEL